MAWEELATCDVLANVTATPDTTRDPPYVLGRIQSPLRRVSVHFGRGDDSPIVLGCQFEWGRDYCDECAAISGGGPLGMSKAGSSAKTSGLCAICPPIRGLWKWSLTLPLETVDEAADPREDAAESHDLPHDGLPYRHQDPRTVSLTDLLNILHDDKFGLDEDNF
ncbi:hypothetical protein BDN71DRAFT_853755 [Pleurotus eryngii]|uniref:Uncharacterized protein n=1 Tax=Pleurotus eryngii TaxID=5323 RepID=A0A9P6DDV9_PLEER|nr:hypothetical protein BDN71DRAFT_853755 [Pleurotus eryngii]